MERSYPQFTVTEKAERNIRAGHPWVYDTELLAEKLRTARWLTS